MPGDGYRFALRMQADRYLPAQPLAYRRPAVRDLAWLVFGGALQLPGEETALERVQLTEDETAELLALLAVWDQDSQDGWLGPITPRLRLGPYAERLIGAWLQHSRQIRLVAMNWPLRENGITLGEADFLVQRHGGRDAGLQLWELACKVYLEVPGHGWVGPGLNDSLPAKLARMRSHQLRLIDHPGFRAAWGSGWSARAWLAGWLLAPAAHAQPGAGMTTVWAEAGDPAAVRAECRGREAGVSEWWALPKRQWLRPVFADEPVARRFEGLAQAAGAIEADRPVALMLAGIRWLGTEGRPVAHEVMRLMLVPPGWSRRAGAAAPDQGLAPAAASAGVSPISASES